MFLNNVQEVRAFESVLSLSLLDYRKFHVTVGIEYYKKGKVYCQTCLITFLSKKKMAHSKPPNMASQHESLM